MHVAGGPPARGAGPGAAAKRPQRKPVAAGDNPNPNPSPSPNPNPTTLTRTRTRTRTRTPTPTLTRYDGEFARLQPAQIHESLSSTCDVLARLADEMRAQSALVAVMGELGEQLARMEARHSEYSHG